MRHQFVISAANGEYTSPIWQISNLENLSQNTATFEFYDDEACTIVSTGVTGSMTLLGKMSENSMWQPIPDGVVDLSNPLSISWGGITYQLQITNNTIVNTNYIKIILDRQSSKN